MAARSCAFKFDPPECERAHPDARLPSEDLTNNGVWECPHPPLEGRDRCLAHADERPAGIDETEWVLETIEGEEAGEDSDLRRRKQFVAAEFDSLEFTSGASNREDPHPVDLRYASVDSLRCLSGRHPRHRDQHGDGHHAGTDGGVR